MIYMLPKTFLNFMKINNKKKAAVCDCDYNKYEIYYGEISFANTFNEL